MYQLIEKRTRPATRNHYPPQSQGKIGHDRQFSIVDVTIENVDFGWLNRKAEQKTQEEKEEDSILNDAERNRTQLVGTQCSTIVTLAMKIVLQWLLVYSSYSEQIAVV